MFYVLNKSKIYSYLIALCTVVILFVAAAKFDDMVSPNTVATSANILNNGILDNSISDIEEDNVENYKNNITNSNIIE